MLCGISGGCFWKLCGIVFWFFFGWNILILDNWLIDMLFCLDSIFFCVLIMLGLVMSMVIVRVRVGINFIFFIFDG